MLSVRPWAVRIKACQPLVDALGRAMHVEPMKPMFKPPGTTRLKLKCDEPLSIFDFRFNLRRYSWARWRSSTWNTRPRTRARS